MAHINGVFSYAFILCVCAFHPGLLYWLYGLLAYTCYRYKRQGVFAWSPYIVLGSTTTQTLLLKQSPRFCAPLGPLRYVNRLSDLLFAAARYASMIDGKPERPWKKLPAVEEPAGTD